VCPRDAHDVQLARHRPVAGDGSWRTERLLGPSFRSDPALAHVAERLRLDRVVEAGMTVEDPEAMAGKPSSFPLRNP
jgi:hypothetical protein